MAGIDMKHLIQSAKVSSEICRASDIPGFQSVEDFLLTCLLLHDSIVSIHVPLAEHDRNISYIV